MTQNKMKMQMTTSIGLL